MKSQQVTGYSALHRLILERRLEELKEALEHTIQFKTAECPTDVYDINATACNNLGGMSRTTLHLAVEEELPEYVLAILEAATLQRRVKVNQAQLEGFTALHLAARKGNVEIAKILLAAGATVNGAPEGGGISLAEPNGNIWPNKTGEIPLHLAVANGHFAMMHHRSWFR